MTFFFFFLFLTSTYGDLLLSFLSFLDLFNGVFETSHSKTLFVLYYFAKESPSINSFFSLTFGSSKRNSLSCPYFIRPLTTSLILSSTFYRVDIFHHRDLEFLFRKWMGINSIEIQSTDQLLIQVNKRWWKVPDSVHSLNIRYGRGDCKSI